MKIHRIFSRFALAVSLALGMVGGTQTAYAEDDYTCIEGGNPPPADGLDGVNIIQNGTSPDVCTLGNVHVKHFLGITDFKTIVTGNLTSDDDKVYINGGVQSNVTTGVLSAGTDIRIGGAVKLGSVTAGTTGAGTVSLSGGNAPLVAGAVSNSNGWVYINSQSTIKIPSIITTGGDVRVFSNLDHTAGVTQKIGAGGIGSVKIDSGSFNSIYVSNTAGIDYSGDNILNANIGSNPGGFVVLDTGAVTDNQNGFENANTGIVTIAGSLNVDGSGGNPAGFINIFASEIIAKGATISASSVNGQVGTINLVTNKISNRSGLTVNVNGNNGTQTIDLSIFPIGSFSMYRPVPLLPIFFSDFTTSTNPLDIVGAGALVINADGNNNGVKIFGYPLKISPASTTISNKGSGNLVTIQGTDGGSQLNKINWGGPIQIHANNTATTGQTANLIEVKATNIAPLTDNVLLDASGGTVNANGSNINLTTKGGNVSLGGSGPSMTLNANGGTLGGDAGNVTIDGGSTKYSLLTSDAITASSLTGDGNGGSISLVTTDDVTAAGTTSANGIGAGHGGTLSITTGAMLDLTQATLEANSGGASTTGGSILLTYKSSSALTILNLSALANNGNGGTIQISNSKNADLVLNVKGLIQTSDTDLPMGSVKLIPGNVQQDNVVLAVTASGGFNSILSATAQSVTLTAEPIITLGLDQIDAKSGDVDIRATDCGTVCVAAVGINQFAPLASQNSKVIVIPSGKIKSSANLKLTVDTVINNGTIIGAQSVTITAGNVINNGKISSPSDQAPITIKAGNSSASLVMSGDGGIVETPDSGSASITIDGGRLNSSSVLTLSGNQTFTTQTLILRAGQDLYDKASSNTVTIAPNSQIKSKSVTDKVSANTLELGAGAKLDSNQIELANFFIKNSGKIEALFIRLEGDSVDIKGGGTIVARGELDAAAVFVNREPVAGMTQITIDNQTIKSVGLNFGGNGISISNTVELRTKGGDLILQFFSMKNEGQITSDNNIQIRTATGSLSTQIVGNGEMSAPTLTFANGVQRLDLHQKSIGATIQGQTLNGLSILTEKKVLTIGDLQNFGGDIVLQTKGDGIEVVSTSGSGLINTGVNVTVQALSSTGGIAFDANSKIAKIGGNAGRINVFVGPAPSLDSTINNQNGIVLQGTAQNGTNVFFGQGISAVPNNTINITSGGLISFNGPHISMSGGVQIGL